MKRFTHTALFLVTIGTAALAQPGPMPPPHPPKDDRLASYLNLTTAQKTQWDAARQAFDEGVKPLREHIEATHEQLEKLMDAKSNDAAALGTLMIDIRNTHDQIKARHDALDAQLETLLTAEQKTKFEAFLAARPPCRRLLRRGGSPDTMPSCNACRSPRLLTASAAPSRWRP